MFLFVLNVIICGGMLLGVVTQWLQSKRGTNAVSRFVRDSGANGMYHLSIMLCGFMFLVDFICAVTLKGFWVIVSLFLPILTLAVAIYLSTQSNKDEQRKKDARVVTKGTLQVTAAVGETAGTAIGAYAGNPMIGKAVGSAVGSIAESAAENMEEQGIKTEKLRESVSALTMRASRAGIETEGRSVDEIASDVIKYASETQLAALPEGLTDTQKALKILGQEEDE